MIRRSAFSKLAIEKNERHFMMRFTHWGSLLRSLFIHSLEGSTIALVIHSLDPTGNGGQRIPIALLIQSVDSTLQMCKVGLKERRYASGFLYFPK